MTKPKKKGRKKSKTESEQAAKDAPVEEQLSDNDDDLLHGVCGEPLIGADSDLNDCLLGKYVAKVFLPEKGDDDKLFTGTITQYDQKKKNLLLYIMLTTGRRNSVQPTFTNSGHHLKSGTREFLPTDNASLGNKHFLLCVKLTTRKQCSLKLLCYIQ